LWLLAVGRRGRFLAVGPVGRRCGFPISGIWAARGAVGLRRDHRPAKPLRDSALTDGCPLGAGQAGLQRGNQKRFHAFCESWLSSSHSAAERTSGAHMYPGKARDEGRGPWVCGGASQPALLLQKVTIGQLDISNLNSILLGHAGKDFAAHGSYGAYGATSRRRRDGKRRYIVW
jgi:hypothetical protein